MRRLLKWALVALTFLFVYTAVVAAQGEPPPPAEPSAGWEFLALAFSSGITTALVQLFRRINLLSLIPDFLRPVIAGVVGIGATALTAFVLQRYGVELDLNAIVAFFGAGGGATALFGIGKNLGLLNSKG